MQRRKFKFCPLLGEAEKLQERLLDFSHMARSSAKFSVKYAVRDKESMLCSPKSNKSCKSGRRFAVKNILRQRDLSTPSVRGYPHCKVVWRGGNSCIIRFFGATVHFGRALTASNHPWNFHVNLHFSEISRKCFDFFCENYMSLPAHLIHIRTGSCLRTVLHRWPGKKCR